MSLALWPQTPSAAWLVSWQAAFHPEAPERLSLFASYEHLGRALVLRLPSQPANTPGQISYMRTYTCLTHRHTLALFSFIHFIPTHPHLTNPDIHPKQRQKRGQYSDNYVISCRNILCQIAVLKINCCLQTNQSSGKSQPLCSDHVSLFHKAREAVYLCSSAKKNFGMSGVTHFKISIISQQVKGCSSFFYHASVTEEVRVVKTF